MEVEVEVEVKLKVKLKVKLEVVDVGLRMDMEIHKCIHSFSLIGTFLRAKDIAGARVSLALVAMRCYLKDHSHEAVALGVIKDCN